MALAPMVRVSELPLRKLCLLNGADLVWGPEVVDKGIISSTRHVNDQLKTIDYISNLDPTKVVFRTCPDIERNKVIFQLGSADPELAVQAGKYVAKDVAGIDLNCGCPMHFSVHSGMGAQLLKTPDVLCSILTNLVEHVGKPFEIPISAKIRVLDGPAKTFDLVHKIVSTGISCLTVHCRTPQMRPREPAFYDYLKEIAQICKTKGVACYVNGDIKSRTMMEEFMEKYGVDGALVAREAQINPMTCFKRDCDKPEQPKSPQEQDKRALEACKEFFDGCVEFGYNKSHVKYNLSTFISGKSPLYKMFTRAKTIEEIKEILDEAQKNFENGVPIKRNPKTKRKSEAKLEKEMSHKPKKSLSNASKRNLESVELPNAKRKPDEHSSNKT